MLLKTQNELEMLRRNHERVNTTGDKVKGVLRGNIAQGIASAGASGVYSSFW